MLLRELVDVSARVAATNSRSEKTALIAALLRGAGADAAAAAAYLTGDARVRTTLGPAAVHAAWDTPAAEQSSLTLADVATNLERAASLKGAGAKTARVQLLRDLFARAQEDERDFLARLVLGELRQGALEGVMADAIARAAALPLEDVRRALLLSGDLATVAAAALDGGAVALRGFGVELFRPLAPMLAQPADDVGAALARLDTAAFDYKLDGARVQVHRRGDEVRIYSRRLNEVTAAAPELVEAVRTLPARELVLDGEAIVLRPDGKPQPFQITMRRFGRRLDVERMRAELPLATFFFDLLYLDGESLLERPAADRFAAMRAVLPDALHVPRLVTQDAAEAASFLQRARDAGHEGLVAKSLHALYDAGKRGGSWLKLKQADTLDLVVLAAEWGHGRRQGWLSNLHLGARDPEHGSFVMLGKTFKGLTDAVLEWQTRELLAREIGREGHIVHVRPELVVEIAFEGLQTSPRYPGGVALRFARVKRYRDDKSAAHADTIARVLELHARSG
jgi:DNA ligase-1